MSETQETSVRRSRPARKPKRSQIPFAIVLTIVAIVIGVLLNEKGLQNEMGSRLLIFWIFGLAFGYVLQRSRFCFTAGFRDPIMTGSTSVSRAVLAALAVGTLGVTAIKYAAYVQDPAARILGQGVAPIGLPLILGAILFGVGMVIAGGCASGTLMRIGEGFQMQWLSVIFFIIGSTWGAYDFGNFWGPTFNENAPQVFLPDVFGWIGALVVQALIIVLLYIAARKWQEKKMGTAE